MPYFHSSTNNLSITFHCQSEENLEVYRKVTIYWSIVKRITKMEDMTVFVLLLRIAFSTVFGGRYL